MVAASTCGLVIGVGARSRRPRSGRSGDGRGRVLHVHADRRYVGRVHPPPFSAGNQRVGHRRLHRGLRHGRAGGVHRLGGALTTIAESGGPFLSVGGNTINAGGTVVVWAELATGGRALLTGNGGFLTTIADTTSFSWLCCRASISDDGTVAFPGGVAGGGDSIFARAAGGPLTIILPDTGPLKFSPGVGPTIDAAGVVVFGASTSAVTSGLYTGSGAAPARIVDKATSGFIDFSIRPAIAAGRVAFEGGSPRHQRHLHEPRRSTSPRSPTAQRSSTTSWTPPSIRSAGSRSLPSSWAATWRSLPARTPWRTG